MSRPVKTAVALATVALLATLALGLTTASAAAPTVTIDPASEVGFNSAKATGEVNPEGEEVNYHFEYVTDAQFNEEPDPVGAPGVKAEWTSANQTGFGSIPAGTSTSTPVESATLEGLAPGTTYHLRLVAENTSGETASAVAPTFPTEPVVRPSVTGFATSAKTSTSIHLEGFVNSGGSGAGEKAGTWEFNLAGGSHHFEEVGFEFADGQNHPVQVDVTGLEPATTYTAVLSARNAQSDAEGLAAEEQITFTTTAIAPTVETTALTGYVSPTGARFLGEVNPNNSQIQSCLFEYGTTAAYGNTVPCEEYPEAEEAGHERYVVGAQADGLAPSTTYHYRLLVDNGAGGPTGGGDRTLTTPPAPASQDQCPNEAIREEQGAAALALPQCMAYELVSPAFSGGESPQNAASGLDGDHAWLYVGAPISGEQVSGTTTTLAATRTEGGWDLHDLATAGELSANFAARSADSSRVIVQTCERAGIPCNSSLPVRDERIEPDGGRTLMLETPSIEGGAAPEVVGVSNDLGRLFLETKPKAEAPLLPAVDTHTHGQGLYVSTDGHLEFLGLGASEHVLPCGEVLANDIAAHQGGNGFEQNGISADGATVFFESPDPAVAGSPGCEEPVDLYMRRNGHTVDISAPTNGNPDLGATYAGNTRDGETVFFTAASKLLPTDTDELPDLYSYDVATGVTTAITVGAEIRGGGERAPRVVVSPEGDYVYFVAERAIAGATDGPGTDGAQNLFVYHAGQIRRIATTARGFFRLGKALGSGEPSISTPDGRHLLFQSEAQLTGQPTGQELPQLFQYDASTDSIACVSCRPDGGVPVKGAGIAKVQPTANVDQRLQSDDGASVLFETSEALLPQDTNGLPDVYLWRDGELHLLGAGHSQSPANVVGTTPDGSSVFFRDTEDLIGTPIGAGTKLYVARVDGGFPAAEAIPTCESAELCHSTPTSAPDQTAAGTATLVGPPNPKAKHKKKHHHKKHKKKHHGKHKQQTAKKSNRSGAEVHSKNRGGGR